MQFEPVDVSTHSGFKADERPTAFTWRGCTRTVTMITDRWYEGGREPGRPALSYFKVLANDGREHILRYNSLFDAWAVVISGRDT